MEELWENYGKKSRLTLRAKFMFFSYFLRKIVKFENALHLPELCSIFRRLYG